jgi:hypothetical protein
MFEPAFPANIKHIIVDENSKRITSLETTPTVNRGKSGDATLRAICITITAPIKNEIIMTIHKELTPSLYISLKKSFINSLNLSGRVRVLFISTVYCPTLSNDSINFISISL